MKKRKAVKKIGAKKQAKRKMGTKTRRAASTAGKRKPTAAKKVRKKTAKAKNVRAKTARKKTDGARTKGRAGRSQSGYPRDFDREEVASDRAGQSGDIQGLSHRAGADSESVEELIEEGNAFEADAVEGVERAGNSVREVRTRQLPEDDVPEEYLDEQ